MKRGRTEANGIQKTKEIIENPNKKLKIDSETTLEFYKIYLKKNGNNTKNQNQTNQHWRAVKKQKQ